MAEPLGAQPAVLGRAWLIATIALTLVPVVVIAVTAPSTGTSTADGLVWLLFVGSSVHIGATAWFFTVPEVRSHMADNPARYVVAPIGLIAVGAVLGMSLSEHAMTWVLVPFFGWQFFHFQRQNLGVTALAATSLGIGRLSVLERRTITVAGVGGIVALLGRPTFLGRAPNLGLGALFDIGGVIFLSAVVVGLVALGRRPTNDRPAPYATVFVLSLLFFVPVFAFDSPYAAVAGITVAHGLQYLLLMGLLAVAPRAPLKPATGVLIMVNLALVVGVLLNSASHLHAGNMFARGLYGSYLGILTAHFVIDAGLWRLRDEFPRAFLSERLPYLLLP